VAKLDWVILCERAVVEAAPVNTVSLVALIENISILTPPKEITKTGQIIGVPFRFYAVQQWSRGKAKKGERTSGRLVFKGPNGKEFGNTLFNVDLMAVPRTRLVTQAMGFPLVGAGAYKCIVEVKRGKGWRALQETEFNVILLPRGSEQLGTSTRH
jgi:hypothetical protein